MMGLRMIVIEIDLTCMVCREFEWQCPGRFKVDKRIESGG